MYSSLYTKTQIALGQSSADLGLRSKLCPNPASLTLYVPWLSPILTPNVTVHAVCASLQ
jgi:hypothetical protein